MGKSEQTRADEAKVEILAPIAPPAAPLSKRHAATKRSAKNPLTELTNKQEAFCQAIMQGHSQAQAYRMAYDTENMTDASIYGAAWELMRNPKITRRLEQLNGWLEEKQRMQAVGMAGFVQEKLLQLAVDPDSPKHVQVKALETLGRSVGMFTDRKEVKTISDDSLPELEAKLKAKMDALRLVNGSGK